MLPFVVVTVLSPSLPVFPLSSLWHCGSVDAFLASERAVSAFVLPVLIMPALPLPPAPTLDGSSAKPPLSPLPRRNDLWPAPVANHHRFHFTKMGLATILSFRACRGGDGQSQALSQAPRIRSQWKGAGCPSSIVRGWRSLDLGSRTCLTTSAVYKQSGWPERSLLEGIQRETAHCQAGLPAWSLHCLWLQWKLGAYSNAFYFFVLCDYLLPISSFLDLGFWAGFTWVKL